MDITDLEVCRAFLLPPAGGETTLDLVMFSTGVSEDAAREAIWLAHEHGYVDCGEGFSRGKVMPSGFALVREAGR